MGWGKRFQTPEPSDLGTTDRTMQSAFVRRSVAADWASRNGATLAGFCWLLTPNEGTHD